MLKLKETKSAVLGDSGKRECVVSIYADQKEEVVDDITADQVDGMNQTDLIVEGSIAMTADWDVAQLDSAGHWHWANDGE